MTEQDIIQFATKAVSKLDITKAFKKLGDFAKYKNIVDKTAYVDVEAQKLIKHIYDKGKVPTEKQCVKAIVDTLNSAYCRKNFSLDDVKAVRQYYIDIKNLQIPDMSDWRGAI